MMLLLSVLEFFIFPLIVGAGVYLGVRFLEKRGREWASLGFLLGSLTILGLARALAQELSQLAVATSFVVAFGGATFHRKSGGASPGWGLAFLLMMFATLLYGVLLIALDYYLKRVLNVRFLPTPLLPWGIPPFVSGLLFAFFCFTPVFWASFSLWAYQKLKLRPGVDRPLEAGEARSDRDASF